MERKVRITNDAGTVELIQPDSRDAFQARRTFEIYNWSTEGETVRMGYVVAYHAAKRAGVIPAERYSLDQFVVEWAIDVADESGEPVDPTSPAAPAGM